MPSDSFAPYVKFNTKFVVQNITFPAKTIKIFHYPINFGGTRDLLQIPGVSEGDIRASLLKGEIRNRFLSSDISLIYSDIELIQFNPEQKAWLAGLGFNTGIAVGYGQLDGYTQELINQGGGGGGGGGGDGYLSPNEHETLRQLIHFIDEGPGDGFASGAMKVISGGPFPTSVTWYLDDTQTKILVEKLITYNTNKTISTITYNMYDTDGQTIIHTVMDTITYTDNVFESTRNRTIL